MSPGRWRMARNPRTPRGFTLVELTIVVVIIGILAALAVYGVQRYVRNARTSEAYSMIASIKAGEEAYRDETYQYFDVSGGDWFNRAPGSPGPPKRDFAAGANGVDQSFAVIGVRPNAPVIFTYAVIAGAPGEQPKDPAVPDVTFNWVAANATAPWYVVRVVGDQDGDNNSSYFVASSFTDEISTTNPME